MSDVLVSDAPNFFQRSAISTEEKTRFYSPNSRSSSSNENVERFCDRCEAQCFTASFSTHSALNVEKGAGRECE